jgi:hypothetical protein
LLNATNLLEQNSETSQVIGKGNKMAKEKGITMKKEELYEIVKNATFEPATVKLYDDNGQKMPESVVLPIVERQVLGDIKKAFNRFGEVVLFSPVSLHGCHTKNEITMMDIVRAGGEYNVSLVKKVLEKHNIQMPIKF